MLSVNIFTINTNNFANKLNKINDSLLLKTIIYLLDPLLHYFSSGKMTYVQNKDGK